MHAEAAVYMAQALGIALPAEWAFPGRPAAETLPPGLDMASLAAAGAALEGLVCKPPAGRWTLGSAAGEGFVFDNELGAHPVALQAFEIDAAPVTWARYLPFVEAGGYQDARWWSPEGWQWVQEAAQRRSLFSQRTGQGAAGEGPGLPRDLRRDEGVWFQRRFDRWQPLDLQGPAVHLSAYEADAWCRWAGRRLPTEAEWECAAMTAPSSAQPPFALGPGLGVDGQRLRALPGLRAAPLPRLLGALVRHAPRAARRQCRDLAAHGAPEVPQFLHPGAQRHLCRLSQLRGEPWDVLKPCFEGFLAHPQRGMDTVCYQ